MNTDKLEHIAKTLVGHGKGLLAADESNASCEKRFDALGVRCTETSRRDYREILLTAPGAEDIMSGVILFEETLFQSTKHGQLFREYLKQHGVMPGIKVDKGLVDLPGFPGEKVTQGLDGLPERMATFAAAGAQFAKWRAVITINDSDNGSIWPTDECIGANTLALARYARICQEAGIVPLVEPEVLFDGKHSIEECEQVLAHTLDILFQTLRAFRVHLPGLILKTSMVLPGKDSGTPINHDDVADRTVRVLREHVPGDVGGVVFLSGGQKPADALINLNKIAQRGPHPWGVTFSYSRALQDPVLKAWAADPDAVHEAKELFKQQLDLASAAAKGELNEGALANDTFVSHAQDL
ncbi:MAG TPA: class I fructose-bisphosphate aldolase [Candidatus Saccharimonadales bacterium]|nr:class I fructose-bisphosphate aldolase [Candidatus Saccharimonadales bacterium]